MGLVVKDDGWRIPDKLWEQMEPLLPPRKKHRYGGHNPRVSDRAAMNAIFFVTRTGCQWGALDATGICNHSSAHRRFMEWTKAGVFEEFWKRGLLQYDKKKEHQMALAFYGRGNDQSTFRRKKNWQKPYRQGKARH